MRRVGLYQLIWLISAAPLWAGAPAVQKGPEDAPSFHRIIEKSDPTIEGLHWVSLRVVPSEDNGKLSATAWIRGRFERPDAHFFIQSHQIILGPDRGFVLRIGLHARQSLLKVMSIDLKGKIEHQLWAIEWPGWDQLQVHPQAALKAAAAKVPSRWGFSAGLGPTAISYTEAGKDPFHESVLTIKAGGSYRLGRRWSLGAVVFGTALPIMRSVTGVQARYIGANARIAYSFALSPRLAASLSTGLYYTTMLVSPRVFGVQNLMGPQLLPVLRYRLGRKTAVDGYVKLAPVGSSFSLLSLSNRELALGLGFSYGRARLGLDLSQLKLKVEGTQLELTTLSLGVGIGF